MQADFETQAYLKQHPELNSSDEATQSSDRFISESTSLIKSAQESAKDFSRSSRDLTHAEPELESAVVQGVARDTKASKSMYYYLLTEPRGLTAFSITFFRSCVLTAFETVSMPE